MWAEEGQTLHNDNTFAARLASISAYLSRILNTRQGSAPASPALGLPDITNFVLSERVEYIDYRLLRDNQIENCYVYAVNASETYKSQTLGAGYLPVCTNLHSHQKQGN